MIIRDDLLWNSQSHSSSKLEIFLRVFPFVVRLRQTAEARETKVPHARSKRTIAHCTIKIAVAYDASRLMGPWYKQVFYASSKSFKTSLGVLLNANWYPRFGR
jgi:hypothetical protein